MDEAREKMPASKRSRLVLIFGSYLESINVVGQNESADNINLGPLQVFHEKLVHLRMMRCTKGRAKGCACDPPINGPRTREKERTEKGRDERK